MIPRRLLLPALLLFSLPLLADRRANVENGLLLAVPVEGEPGLKLQDRLRHYGVPGLSVAVWKNGKLDWTAGYGNVKADTLLQAGSISKSLTAVATLRVLARHKIPLSADINKHLRSWKLPADGVTIEKILAHKAGLNVPGFPGFERGDPIPSLIDELEGRGNTQALRVTGDTRYSGGGYLLLQQLLIDLEKKPIDDILAAEVLRPAKMRDSTFAQPLPATLQARAASGTTEEGEAVPGGSYIFPEKTAAGLWTTAADVARFVIALQKRKLLSPALTKRLLDDNFGVLPYRKHYFAHAGGNNGFFALYVATREGADGAVVLSNTEIAEPLIHEILRAVAKEYRWPEYAPQPVRLVKADPEKVVGRYGFDRDDVLTVRPADGRLLVKRTAEKDVLLDPLSDTEWVNRETGELYIFRGNAVKVGDAVATRTRTSVPLEVAVLDFGVAAEEYRLSPPELVTEERLRKRGLWLLKQGYTKQAVQFLQMNADKYPKSAAAYDALATAQLAAGDVAAARASSQKVLEALATDWTATASWRQVYRKRAERRLRDGTSR